MNKIIFILAALPLLAAFGCGKKEAPAPKIPGVKTVTLAPASITETMTLSGTVESKSRAWLVAPADGAVMTISRQEGDAVARGEVLLTIMPLEQQNLLGQASADYEAAKKSDDAAALEAASERYEAAKKLYKPFPVASPLDGTVILRKVEVGENVAARQNLLAVADMGRLVMKTAVSEKYAGRVRRGQGVKVSAEGCSVPLNGEISLVSPGINTDSRTADLEIKLPAHPALRPGMAAAAELVVAGNKNAIVLPLDALVIKPDGSTVVFVIEDNKARLVKVKTGIEANERVEIAEGLKFGQAVAVAGHETLKDGAQVKVAGEGEKGGGKAGGDKKGK